MVENLSASAVIRDTLSSTATDLLRRLDHTVQNLGRNKPTDEAPIMYKVIHRGGALVRAGYDTSSSQVHQLAAGEVATVVELHGRRARIITPVEGWVSTETKEGVMIMKPTSLPSSRRQEAFQAAFEQKFSRLKAQKEASNSFDDPRIERPGQPERRTPSNSPSPRSRYDNRDDSRRRARDRDGDGDRRGVDWSRDGNGQRGDGRLGDDRRRNDHRHRDDDQHLDEDRCRDQDQDRDRRDGVSQGASAARPVFAFGLPASSGRPPRLAPPSSGAPVPVIAPPSKNQSGGSPAVDLLTIGEAPDPYGSAQSGAADGLALAGGGSYSNGSGVSPGPLPHGEGGGAGGGGLSTDLLDMGAVALAAPPQHLFDPFTAASGPHTTVAGARAADPPAFQVGQAVGPAGGCDSMVGAAIFGSACGAGFAQAAPGSGLGGVQAVDFGAFTAAAPAAGFVGPTAAGSFIGDLAGTCQGGVPAGGGFGGTLAECGFGGAHTDGGFGAFTGPAPAAGFTTGVQGAGLRAPQVADFGAFTGAGPAVPAIRPCGAASASKAGLQQPVPQVDDLMTRAMAGVANLSFEHRMAQSNKSQGGVGVPMGMMQQQQPFMR